MEIDIPKISSELLKDIDKIFNSFEKLSIAVFGDVMLDEYLVGDSNRISPEAPVPVVKIEKTYYTAGGAANTAMNIKKLGLCRVKIFSIVGEDQTADRIEEIMRNSGIETTFIRESKRNTPKKTRVIARGQQVLRIDSESTERAKAESVSKILKEFYSDKFDIVVFSDYAKGNITQELNDIISRSKSVCDPKPQNIRIFQGAYMILPNEKEAREIFQLLFPDSAEKIMMEKILEKLGVKKIVITQGEKGMLFLSSEKFFHVPALAKEVYDVTGAGDTVSSVFALCEGSGLEDEKTSVLSSIAASIKVLHRGTYTPTRKEIIAALKQLQNQNYTNKT